MDTLFEEKHDKATIRDLVALVHSPADRDSFTFLKAMLRIYWAQNRASPDHQDTLAFMRNPSRFQRVQDPRCACM